ncbi:DUF3786 domain-containing protein [Desulfocastanea catecholica]
MGVGKNAMEIFSVLDKSNCRECGEKTCLAFAGAVYLGKRRIEECPHLGREDIAKVLKETGQADRREDSQDEYIAEMLQEVVNLDFRHVAERIGARVNGDVLIVPILGKNFGIHRNGTFVTDIHINPWVVSPLLDYVLKCKGVPVTGEWISFREIGGGKEKYALFKKRGEDVLKQLGDKYPDFFNDIVHMFSGKSVEERFESDVSVVLHPFPLVPIMICYWKPEEGLASSLNVFFDKSVDDNLGIDAAFFLGTGMAKMFEKLAEHHGF